MPKTKTQGVVFGIIMSMAMAYGMEVYNVASKMGFTTMPGGFSNMTNIVFWEALKEAAYMWIFVFLFSNLWGNRIGHGLAGKIIRLEQDNPFFITLTIWAGTVFKNFPMALIWNLFAAGPFTRWLFEKIYKDK